MSWYKSHVKLPVLKEFFLDVFRGRPLAALILGMAGRKALQSHCTLGFVLQMQSECAEPLRVRVSPPLLPRLAFLQSPPACC